MKKILLVSSLSLAFGMMATVAQADYANVSIDSDIVLNYDQEIDMTNAVQVPTNVDLGDNIVNVVNQNNHNVTVNASGDVTNNNWVQGDIQVDVTAVGNNASIAVVNADVIGSEQGNQNTDINATGLIVGNRIGASEVELNATAVGNNLSISKVDAYDNDVSVGVGAVQFNYDSDISAVGIVSHNQFGVPKDPTVNVTAVGNNISSIDSTRSSTLQLNKGTTISAIGTVNNNLGNAHNHGTIGPINVAVTAVGNNLSISVPTKD